MYKFWEFSFTDQIQAYCATMTLILAIIVTWQSSKIKSLTDVVSSLNEQSKISQQLLEFEIRSRIKDAHPVFRTGVIKIMFAQDFYSFSLYNIGIRARGIKFEKNDNPNVVSIKKENVDNRVINTGEAQVGIIKFIDFMKDYSFDVFYEDDFANEFKQTIRGSQGRMRISSPIPIETTY